MAGARRAAVVLIGIPLALAFAQAGLSSQLAGASCAGPQLSVSSGVVAPGGRVVVEGTGFGTDCNDTGGDGPPLGDPQEQIPVELQQSGGTTRLGTVDANSAYQVRLSVRVPGVPSTGNATIRVGAAAIVVAVQGPPTNADDTRPTLTDDAGPAPADLGGRSPITTALIAITAAALGVLGAVLVVRRRHRGQFGG